MDGYLIGGKEEGRFFVALPVSSGLIEQCKFLAAHSWPVDGNWLCSDDLHITIRFLGYVGNSDIPAIERALARVRRPVFNVDVNGLDAFYNKREVILYADVVSVRKLTALCTDISDVLVPLGFDFGTRPYVPHVTFARFKSGILLDNHMKTNEKNIKSDWRSNKFHLMRSTGPDKLGSKRYEIISSYDLIDDFIDKNK